MRLGGRLTTTTRRPGTCPDPVLSRCEDSRTHGVVFVEEHCRRWQDIGHCALTLRRAEFGSQVHRHDRPDVPAKGCLGRCPEGGAPDASSPGPSEVARPASGCPGAAWVTLAAGEPPRPRVDLWHRDGP